MNLLDCDWVELIEFTRGKAPAELIAAAKTLEPQGEEGERRAGFLRRWATEKASRADVKRGTMANGSEIVTIPGEGEEFRSIDGELIAALNGLLALYERTVPWLTTDPASRARYLAAAECEAARAAIRRAQGG